MGRGVLDCEPTAVPGRDLEISPCNISASLPPSKLFPGLMPGGVGSLRGAVAGLLTFFLSARNDDDDDGCAVAGLCFCTGAAAADAFLAPVEVVVDAVDGLERAVVILPVKVGGAVDGLCTAPPARISMTCAFLDLSRPLPHVSHVTRRGCFSGSQFAHASASLVVGWFSYLTNARLHADCAASMACWTAHSRGTRSMARVTSAVCATCSIANSRCLCTCVCASTMVNPPAEVSPCVGFLPVAAGFGGMTRSRPSQRRDKNEQTALN